MKKLFYILSSLLFSVNLSAQAQAEVGHYGVGSMVLLLIIIVVFSIIAIVSNRKKKRKGGTFGQYMTKYSLYTLGSILTLVLVGGAINHISNYKTDKDKFIGVWHTERNARGNSITMEFSEDGYYKATITDPYTEESINSGAKWKLKNSQLILSSPNDQITYDYALNEGYSSTTLKLKGFIGEEYQEHTLWKK